MPGVALGIVLAALFLVGVLLVRVVILARRTDLSGYGFGGEVVVRCRDGHLFTTIWLPLVSVKAIRLGWLRLQYCPVGDHLTLVVRVRPQDLTDRARRLAARVQDRRMP
jgi:hypothetical protein